MIIFLNLIITFLKFVLVIIPNFYSSIYLIMVILLFIIRKHISPFLAQNSENSWNF